MKKKQRIKDLNMLADILSDYCENSLENDPAEQKRVDALFARIRRYAVETPTEALNHFYWYMLDNYIALDDIGDCPAKHDREMTKLVGQYGYEIPLERDSAIEKFGAYLNAPVGLKRVAKEQA